MIKCLAIDDEPLALEQLTAYIQKVPFLELVASCRSAIEARKLLEEEPIDAIFVDINMPDMGGIDFVHSLAAPPLEVFTTAYSEYALEGYKVDAVDYLLKPFGLDEFRRAANKVKARHDLIVQSAMTETDPDDALFLRCEYKTVRLAMADICYVKSMSEYLRIFVYGRFKPYTVLLAIKRLEDRLPAASFMRVHRSYIINLRHIREVEKGRVIMDDNTPIPVGGLYKDNFENYIKAKRLGNK